MPTGHVRHVNYFLRGSGLGNTTRKGFSFYAVFEGGSKVKLTTKNLNADVYDREGYVGLVSKAPATGWHGEYYCPETGRSYRTGDKSTLKAAVAALFEQQGQAQAYVERLKDPEYALEEALKVHDWYHFMSDSFGTCQAGSRHLDKIKGLLAQVPKKVGRKLWKQYAPQGKNSLIVADPYKMVGTSK